MTGNDTNRLAPNLDDGAAQARFGTFGGVFTPCVLTILGVIMFMRAGFVVGHSGLWLAFVILGISKLITTLTALSISAISTNTQMRGGGVYFMISRVLGPDFGGSIGITLFLAQAVGVAFYVIGFTEAVFSVAAPLLTRVEVMGMDGGQWVEKLRLVQIVSTIVVIGLFKLTFKGADVAIKAQYIVLAILLLSVAAFLAGGALSFDQETFAAAKEPRFSDGMGFWTAFAIFFPAATGITAGANMSGDLRDPARAIPRGTILAILFTAAIYVTQFVLMAGSTSRDALKATPFEALQQMSLFGPLVVVGVFAATLSSALGSFLGAPRILQAMGHDRLMRVMTFFAKGAGPTNEPRRATILTFLIAVGVIWAGDLNAVAEVISMFFLIAYGMINLSAFVESKSGNPSFRPTFRLFHWTTALAGAIGCAVAMLKINDTYALIALAVTGVIYFYLKKRDIKTNFGDAKRGFIFQRTKDNLLHLEGSKAHPKNWRPIMVTVSENPIRETKLMRVGAWLEGGRGLYTVAQIVSRPQDGLAARVRFRQDRTEELRRILMAEGVEAFPEVLVTVDHGVGLSDFLQSYSIGALRPNTALVRMPHEDDDDAMTRFWSTVETIATFNMNLTVLREAEMDPDRKRRRIDLWWHGEKNGSLMALFAYLMTLDPAWSGAHIRFLRTAASDAEEREAVLHLNDLRGRIRIPAEIKVIQSTRPPSEIIIEESGTATDLVFLGMRATSADEARRSLEELENLLDLLPTAILVWSNGEADVFA